MDTLSGQRLRVWVLTGVALVGLGIAIRPMTALPPFISAGDHAVYELHSPIASSVVEPLVHAPWLHQVPAAAAGLLAALVTLAGTATAMAFGASPAGALAVTTAMVLSPQLSATLQHAGPASVALLCVWAAWWLIVRRDGSAATSDVILSALLIAAGGWWHWTALFGVPLLVVVACAGAPVRVRAWRAGLLALSAGAAIALYVAHVTVLAREAVAPAQLPLGMADVWSALHDEVPRPGRLAFVGPDAAPAWSALGIALALAGLVAPRWRLHIRPGLAVTMAVAAVIGSTYTDFRDEVTRFAVWMTAPLAAVGLTWIAGQAPIARQPWITAAIAVVLITAGLAAAERPPGIGDLRLFAERFSASLAAAGAAMGTARPAIVAEDTIVDSAVVALGGGLHRMPQRVDAAAFAWSHGTPVIAGPEGRRHLEVLGLVFRRVQMFSEPVHFDWSAVIERYRCVALREDRWSLLPGLEFTGRIGLEVPAGLGGELRLIVGDALPVALRAERPDGSPAPIQVETLLNGPSSNPPPPDYWFDGGDPQRAPGEIVRATIAAHPAAERIVAVHLGRRSPRVLARLHGYSGGARGRVCAAPLGPDRLLATAQESQQTVALETPAFFGTGWYGLEGSGADAFRWSTADGVLLVPMERRGAVRVTARVTPAASGGDPPVLRLSVNGIDQTSVPMPPGAADYTWDVPARAWVTGVNDLHFHVSRTARPSDAGGGDRRVLGIALHALTLEAIAR